MDESAIKQIQLSQAITSANDIFSDSLDDVIFLPDNFSPVDLEKYLPNRRRFRGKFATALIDEFVSYVKDNLQPDVECFVDPDAMSAMTVFDLHNGPEPGHGAHKATVTLRKTPEYKALLEINARQTDQQDMAEFMEDYIEFLTFTDADGESIDKKKAVNAIRKITIEAVSKSESEVGDFKAERSALESVTASSKDGLPKNITFSCVPYDGLVSFDFPCRLSIAQTGGGVGVRLTIRALDTIIADMANDFSTKIEKALQVEGMKLYRGTFDYA